MGGGGLVVFEGRPAMKTPAVGAVTTGLAKASSKAARAGSEPRVRVGVILPQDKMQRVDLVLPAGEYRLRGSRRTDAFVLPAGTPCQVSLQAGRVQLTCAGASSVGLFFGNPVSILPLKEQPIKPKVGILVRRVVAGRSFHWRKRIDQHLQGHLHFYLERGRRHLTMVNELPAETYLAGVITSEMSSACPLEFLKSQAVVARSWLLKTQKDKRKHARRPFTICNDDDCQRYQGSDGLTLQALKAIEETRGLIIRNSDGTISNAVYSKSCGGITADPVNIWREPIKGCQATLDAPDDSAARQYFPVDEKSARQLLTGDWLAATDIFCSPNVVPEKELPKYLSRVDEPDRYFRWQVLYTGQDLADLLRRRREFTDLETVLAIEPAGRGPSGRLRAVSVRYRDRRGRTRLRLINGQHLIRQALHPSYLYSSAFVVDHIPATKTGPARFTLRGGGWGHGVGLCQIGALGMALKGYTLQQIITHYYKDVTLTKQYQ